MACDIRKRISIDPKLSLAELNSKQRSLHTKNMNHRCLYSARGILSIEGENSDFAPEQLHWATFVLPTDILVLLL